MIGNDVVDLQLARIQSNWQRKGFLEKVFNTSEQELIRKSDNPEQVVWTLWSMKEAAYKAHQRLHDLPRHLNWKLYCCAILGESGKKVRGVVKTQIYQYYTNSNINSEYILTTATKERNSEVESSCDKASMKTVKEKLISQVSHLLSVPENQLSLKKNGHGIPFITYFGEEIYSLFSLTDHGNFAAYTLSLTNS